MANLDGKNSCGKSHKGGDKFSPAGALVETYFVPAKPVKTRKLAFCSPSIPVSHIMPGMIMEFKLKKSSKQWDTLILSAEETWETLQAASADEIDSHTTDSGATGVISFLPDITDFSPPEAIVVPNAVFIHEGDDIAANMSEPLVSTRDAINTAVGKLQELAASLPQVGTSTAEYIRPVLNSIIEKINQHSDSIVELYTDNAELTSVNQDAVLARGAEGGRRRTSKNSKTLSINYYAMSKLWRTPGLPNWKWQTRLLIRPSLSGKRSPISSPAWQW